MGTKIVPGLRIGPGRPSGSAETVLPKVATAIMAAATRPNTDCSDDMATPCRLAIRRDNDTGGSKVPWGGFHVFEMNCSKPPAFSGGDAHRTPRTGRRR